ncbi:MAG TPA: hypothetical protein PLJ27_04595 [Polyangiaceae bacterium]|nr:hypothetical protein [Polyangiaceae bacterium]HQB43536.1 hypothetical protein [Polyangiaceae bacterium]HQF24883.1 hypothetical protein [Polyangiaceae bacterium]HQK16711.1 hypothetical protein [Polyangiaceae bacterium]HQM11375.1 hypothetical protein [Polyangiaceae bacterium]
MDLSARISTVFMMGVEGGKRMRQRLATVSFPPKSQLSARSASEAASRPANPSRCYSPHRWHQH